MQVWQPYNLSAVCTPTSQIPGCDFGLVYLSLLVQLYGGSVDQNKQDACDREAEPGPKDGKEYDFIVVGAGAAGCVVGNRLTENHNWKVLLVEAGPEEPDVARVPGLLTPLLGSNVDWWYSTEPNGESCLAQGGRCSWPRGKTMGGSTAINGMAYVRGNRVDYDTWVRMGNRGWGYEDVLPFFMKSETNMNKYAVDSDFHGARGEQYVSWLPQVDDSEDMIVEAFTERGIPRLDFNGAEQSGTMKMQAFALDGERVSANAAYIRPIRYIRSNLHIETNSEARKILIDNSKNVYGIVYRKDGRNYTAYAKKEVIISAGTINSPKLLMLSGIGPKEHLQRLNIPVVKNLAVGENLHDHVSFDGIIIALSNQTATAAVSREEVLRTVNEFPEMKIKKGPLTGLGPLLASSFLKTEPYLIAPDVQYQASPVANLRELLRDPSAARIQSLITPMHYYDALIPRPMNLVPKSRGVLLLNKTNPYGPPLLHPNYLADDRDLIPLMKGIRFVLSLENTAAFRSRGAYFVREKMPHCKQYDWGTDEYFICLIKQYTSTTHHQVGTCKMGPIWDKNAVVDNELRVYGVKSLRVIDASIMPVVIRGNTEAPTIMIGERGVDFVINHWRNRTNNYCF